MRIQYLPVNQYWVLLCGDLIVDIDGFFVWESREALVAALAAKGLGVNDDGTVFDVDKAA